MDHARAALTQPGAEFSFSAESARTWEVSGVDVAGYAARRLEECEEGLSGHLGRYFHRKRAALLHHQIDGES